MNSQQAHEYAGDCAAITHLGGRPLSLVVYVPVDIDPYSLVERPSSANIWYPVFRNLEYLAFLLSEVPSTYVLVMVPLRQRRISERFRYVLKRDEMFCVATGDLLVLRKRGTTYQIEMEGPKERAKHWCPGCCHPRLYNPWKLLIESSRKICMVDLRAHIGHPDSGEEGLFVGGRQLLALRSQVDGRPLNCRAPGWTAYLRTLSSHPEHSYVKLVRESRGVRVVWNHRSVLLPLDLVSLLGEEDSEPDREFPLACFCGGPACGKHICGHPACEACLENECLAPIHAWLPRLRNSASQSDRARLAALLQLLGDSEISLAPMEPPAAHEKVATYLGSIVCHAPGEQVRIDRRFYYRGYLCSSSEQGLRALHRLDLSEISAVRWYGRHIQLLLRKGSHESWHVLRMDVQKADLREVSEMSWASEWPSFWKAKRGLILDCEGGRLLAGDLPMPGVWLLADGRASQGWTAGGFSFGNVPDWWGGLRMVTCKAEREFGSPLMRFGSGADSRSQLLVALSRDMLRMCMRKLGEDEQAELNAIERLDMRAVSYCPLGSQADEIGERLLGLARWIEARIGRDVLVVDVPIWDSWQGKVNALVDEEPAEESILECVIRESEKKYLAFAGRGRVMLVQRG